MMRPIDGEQLLEIERLLDTDVVRKSKTASWLLDQVLHDIQAMSTLPQPSNEPLTLDELREMDGEPVWCEWLLPEDKAIEQGKWFIVVSGDEAGLEIKRPIEYGCYFCKIDEYGKTWLAYRRKLEEGEDA